METFKQFAYGSFDDMLEREVDVSTGKGTENRRDIEGTQTCHIADSISFSPTARYMGTVGRR